MKQISDKEKRIISITLASFGVFMIGSGLIMNAQVKPIINTKYTLSLNTKRISEAQAKKKEIKVKNFEIELNTPISVDIKDYLEEVDKIDVELIKKLKLDTSLVNINQVGKYQYTITCGKKKYLGNITVKEKEVKPPPFTVKEKITIPKGGTLDVNNKALYLNNTPPADVLANIIIDISAVDLGKVGPYQFSVTYLDTKYTGIIDVIETDVVTQNQQPQNQNQTQAQPTEQKKDCPSNASPSNNPDNPCVCADGDYKFYKDTWKCEKKTT